MSEIQTTEVIEDETLLTDEALKELSNGKGEE